MIGIGVELAAQAGDLGGVAGERLEAREGAFGFGLTAVSSARRVPMPPARMTSFMKPSFLTRVRARGHAP